MSRIGRKRRLLPGDAFVHQENDKAEGGTYWSSAMSMKAGQGMSHMRSW